MLQLGLSLRSFSAIDAQLGDEGEGNHDVCSSDGFISSDLSVRGAKA